MMKYVKNNLSKKYIYNGQQAHFPSKIIEGELGVDVYNPTELDTGTKNRTYEFWLDNEQDSNISGVNLTVNFGDGQSFTDTGINISDNLWLFIQNNYSSGGDYGIGITADYSTTGDTENISIKFGARANDVKAYASNVSDRIFELEIYNDIIEDIVVDWNCTYGSGSVSLSGNETAYRNISHNFTIPGDKTFSCSVVSDDGNESKSKDVTIKGFEIEDYDILITDVSKRIIGYDLKNYFDDVEANISMVAESESFSKLANISSDKNVMVFVETNYSSDDVKSFEVDIITENYSANYVETFKTEGVSIENYDRQNINYTKNVIIFDVVNNWYSGDVNWTLNEPDISNMTNLDKNETLMVIVEQNSTVQGDSRAEVTAKTSEYEDKLKNAFIIRPLDLVSLSTLSEGTNSVTEIHIRNNLESPLIFNWLFETGVEEISSSEQINITSDDVLVFIETNYSSSGVYKTSALVNSSSYNDTQQGVVVV